MSASNNPINNSRPLGAGLGEEELPTGGLLEQATLDESLLLTGNQSSGVGNGALARDLEELTPLEVTQLSLDELDNLFNNRPRPPFQSPGSPLSPQQFQEAAAAAFDPLTGTIEQPPISTSTPAPVSASADPIKRILKPSEFAIEAGGRVIVNGGGDLDGAANNPSDDARIYAGQGFEFNRIPVLPVQLDEQGKAVVDDDGKPVLIEQAVAVSTNYAVARASNNPYSNLTPPQVVATRSIELPTFAQLSANELGFKLSEGVSIVDYNPNQRLRLNSAADWQSNFPPSGSAANPTVVRIANGGLRIPQGVDLRNTVIIVENGSINFNGNQHELHNVVLVAEQGSINLSNSKLKNSSVLAKRSIRMNRGAEFSGRTVLANGDRNSELTFNGATRTTAECDKLTVIAQGRLTFNGSADTRANLLAGGDITFNGSTQLVGSVRSQQDIRFNGHITVQAEQGSPVRDTKAPTVTVELVNDTGVSDSDRITSNINMQGRVHDNREVVGLLARFADSSDGEFVDVSSNLQPNGRFSFSAFQLEEMKGDSIAPGQHSLQLIAQDSSGNLSAPVQLSFILEGAPQDPEDSQRDSSSGDGQNSGENLGGENSSGSSNPSTPLPFTITAERTIHINQGGDFDGAPDNLTDDAFIYAGRGYTINSRPEIAVERDVDSNPVLDEFGLPVLRDRALAVSSDHGQINAPTDLYSELRTPQVVDSQTVTVPAWNQLRDEQLSDLPHSIRTVQRLSGLNSISDWNQAVPSGSSPDNLTYLRIQQGGLTIPGGAELRNAVVIVDSGTININGDATFENVVLMVNQGNVNLKGITASNLEVYASDAINVNSQASFEGNNSLVAGRHIHFNGHAQTVDTDDYLKVVANGNLTFNSSADIHADLLTGNDFKSNQATTLYGTLGAKRNIHFNAYIKVFGKSGVTDPQTNQAPTDIALDRDEIAENSVGGVDIGQLSTTDPDTGDTHTYTLVDNPEGLFVIDADRLQLAANAQLDFEVATSHTVTVRSTDSGDPGLFVERELEIRVLDVNETPTLISLSGDSVAENSNGNTVVGTLSTTDPDIGDSHTYSLVNDEGVFAIDGDRLVVAPGAQLDFETTDFYTLTIRSTDSGNPGLFVEQEFLARVLDVNEAPTAIALDNAVVAENRPGSTVVGELSTTDPDVGDSHVYSLTDDAEGTFQIVDNRLEVADGAELDFEARTSYRITVRSSDNGAPNQFVEREFEIAVADVNETPTAIELGSTTVFENSAGNTVVGELLTVDPDFEGSHTYSLVDGDGLFAIDGDRLVVAEGAELDFESVASHSVTIRSTDSGNPGLFVEQEFEIRVIDVNEAPISIGLSGDSVVENSAAGTEIGSLSTVDPDAGDSHTYSLVNDEGLFAIDGDRLVVADGAQLDYESEDFHRLVIRSTDSGNPNQFVEQEVLVQVLDVNEAPTAISLTNASVPENSPARTVVGEFSTLDPDFGDVHTYSLTDNAGGIFQIVNNRLEVAEGAELDFEAVASYQITVRSTDDGTPGLFREQTFEISLVDVNEAPEFTSTPVSTVEAGQLYEYVITTNDPEADDRSIAAIELPDWLSLIDNGDGTATLSGTPGFEDAGFYPIELSVTDSAGNRSIQSVPVSVNFVLREQTDFVTDATIQLTVPENASVLSFTLDPIDFDLGDPSSINDALEIALLDESGNSLLHTFERHPHFSPGLRGSVSIGICEASDRPTELKMMKVG